MYNNGYIPTADKLRYKLNVIRIHYQTKLHLKKINKNKIKQIY